jgi:hypothetical protein
MEHREWERHRQGEPRVQMDFSQEYLAPDILGANRGTGDGLCAR